jgi:hypothetical protein
MRFNNVFECYSEIGKWLSNEAPEAWEKITIDFRIIVIDDVCEYVIDYVPDNSDTEERQFFIDDTNFWDCFYQLARLTSTLEKGFFKKCIFALYKNGKYKCDFEY